MYLDEFAKETASNVVVRLHEYFPQPGLSNGVVFGVEFVETMEGVSILNHKVERVENLIYKTRKCEHVQ